MAEDPRERAGRVAEPWRRGAVVVGAGPRDRRRPAPGGGVEAAAAEEHGG